MANACFGVAPIEYGPSVSKDRDGGAAESRTETVVCPE
jgi:hypothetical protein